MKEHSKVQVIPRKIEWAVSIKVQLYIAMLVLVMFSQLIAYIAYTLDPGALILYKPNFWLQGIYGLFLSGIVASVVFLLPYGVWLYIFYFFKKFRYTLAILTIVALGFLLTPWASARYGAKRWLFGFQVSDIAKFSALILVVFVLDEIWKNWKLKGLSPAHMPISEFILTLATLLILVFSMFVNAVLGSAIILTTLIVYVVVIVVIESRISGTNFFYMALLYGIMYLLILFEPDISTSSLFAMWFLAMLMLWYGRRGMLISLTIMIGIVLLAITLRHVPLETTIPPAFSHAIDRLVVWRSPFIDPNGISYHIVKNYLAVFKGGLWGSYPINIAYIPPVPWSDAILPFTAVSMGILFEFLLVILWFLWGIFFLVSGLRMRGIEGMFVSGFSLWFLLQVIFNMLSTYDIFPPTGISIPFLSWGRTGLIIFTTLNSISAVLVSMHWDGKNKDILRRISQ